MLKMLNQRMLPELGSAKKSLPSFRGTVRLTWLLVMKKLAGCRAEKKLAESVAAANEKIEAAQKELEAVKGDRSADETVERLENEKKAAAGPARSCHHRSCVE